MAGIDTTTLLVVSAAGVGAYFLFRRPAPAPAGLMSPAALPSSLSFGGGLSSFGLPSNFAPPPVGKTAAQAMKVPGAGLFGGSSLGGIGTGISNVVGQVKSSKTVLGKAWGGGWAAAGQGGCQYLGGPPELCGTVGAVAGKIAGKVGDWTQTAAKDVGKAVGDFFGSIF